MFHGSHWLEQINKNPIERILGGGFKTAVYIRSVYMSFTYIFTNASALFPREGERERSSSSLSEDG